MKAAQLSGTRNLFDPITHALIPPKRYQQHRDAGTKRYVESSLGAQQIDNLARCRSSGGDTNIQPGQ